MADDDLNIYTARHVTRMSITTSTVAYDSNLRIPYVDLSKYVKANGEEVLAVKSTCLPLEDCVEGGKYTKAERILKRRERARKKRGDDYGKPSRTLSGNQLYFQSSVEFVRRYGEKYHNIRISPARGSIQIQGVQDPIFQTAESEIRKTLDYITEYMPHIDNDFELVNRRIIIINIKCCIGESLLSKYTNIRIDKMANLMCNLMELQMSGGDLPIEVPYSIIFVTNQYEVGSYIRIKFITPIRDNIDRKTTIKVFSGCKINFLGCPTLECPIKIYKFLDDFIELYESIILFKKPHPCQKDAVSKYISNINKNKHAWVTLVKDNITSSY